MSAKEEEFLKSLRATFKVEAAEHLQAIAAHLLELEKRRRLMGDATSLKRCSAPRTASKAPRAP